MGEESFLIVKLGSLGDLIFTLPAVAALRQAHPQARIDWVVERRWYPLLESNPDLTNVVILDRASAGSFLFTAWRLRAARYTCAVDFQGLYKSAVLACFTGAPVRLGFTPVSLVNVGRQNHQCLSTCSGCSLSQRYSIRS